MSRMLPQGHSNHKLNALEDELMGEMHAKTHFALHNNVHYCSPVLTLTNFSQTLQHIVT
jgi:hypothetical protein